jgi:hypothetical protein
VLLIGAGTETPEAVARALARGEVLEVARADGRWDDLGEAVRDAVLGCRGQLVWPLTPDAEIADDAWTELAAAAAANPDAEAFRTRVSGLVADPRWRGRRCRSHERNLESLRFARLTPLGGLAARRDALVSETRELGPDWWRALGERLARATRIAPTGATIGRSARLPGEPATPGFAEPAALGSRRVLVLGQIEVSTSLYFDVLESLPGASVGFRPLTGLSIDAPHLAAADLVILVRELHRFWDEGVIAFLEAAKVPYLYFTDDNFLELRAEGDAPSFYSARRVRRALSGARAIWVSTPPLGFAHAELHPNVALWRPALDPVLLEAAPPPPEKLTIAIAGGDFRLAGLSGPLAEGLREIASAGPLRIIATEAWAKPLAEALPGAEIIALPLERSFRQFVRQWRRFGVDILLHPAGATRNAPYKCPTAVIVAGYLGATPVVADEPAYDGWGVSSGVVRLGADGAGLATVARQARDPDWRGRLAERLAAALEARFGTADRAAMLAAVLAGGRSPGPAADEVLAAPGFRLRRLGLWLARAARRLLTLSR